MSQYVASIIRFLPNPENGEFINVGAIVGDPKTGYWVVRGALIEARLLALTNNVKDLHDIEEFIQKLKACSIEDLGNLPRDTSAIWLDRVRVEQTNQHIQISPAESVEAGSPEAYLQTLFGKVILEDPNAQRSDLNDLTYSYGYHPTSTNFLPTHQGAKTASELDKYFDDCLGEKNNRHKKNHLIKSIAYLGQSLQELVIAFEKLLYRGTDKILRKLNESNKKRRMLNPIYKEIENRRHREDSNYTTLYSEEANLGKKEFELQHEIGELIDKNPWWAKPIRLIHNENLISDVLYIAKHRGQMLSRGWADSDAFSLNSVLCSRLGGQLLTLSHQAYTTPAFGVYFGSDKWIEDLHKYGYALRVYGEFNASDEVDRDYFAGIDENIAEGEPGYWEQHLDREEYALKKAQEALHWVATYLPSISG